MAKLYEIQEPFEKAEEKIIEEAEKEIQKESQKARDKLAEVAAEYNEKYSGGYIPVKQQKEMNKKFTAIDAALSVAVGKIIYDKMDKNMSNKYYGRLFSYEKVSKIKIPFEKLTKKQKRITIMDKIGGKTYVKRLNFHSKNLTKTTAAIVKNGVRLGFSNDQIAKNITKRVGVTYNQALTIARTEVGRMGSISEDKAEKLALKQGLKITKTWKHYRSPGERADHILMDGVKVAGGTMFVLPNGEECPRPRIGLSAGQTINCKCKAKENYIGGGKGEGTVVGSFTVWIKDNNIVDFEN
jgi:hypothetical protein